MRELQAATALAQSLVARGELAEARRALGPIVASFEQSGNMQTAGPALQLLRSLESGR